MPRQLLVLVRTIRIEELKTKILLSLDFILSEGYQLLSRCYFNYYLNEACDERA